MGGATDVHGGEDGEDVGLQEADQHLEERDADEHRERQDADRLEEQRVALHEFLGEDREGDEQHVTGEQVGEETHSQRERTDEERRDQFDRGHKHVQRRRNTRGEERALEVATHALVLETDPDEDGPHDEGEEERNGHAGGGRHVEDRDDAGQVAQVDEHEQAHQERRPTEAGPAHRRHDHLLLDELDDHLGEVADALGRL